MVNIIKRGGFREQAARQLKYKNSVNQRADISAQKAYQPAHPAESVQQDQPIMPENQAQVDSTPDPHAKKVSSNPKPKNHSTHKNS